MQGKLVLCIVAFVFLMHRALASDEPKRTLKLGMTFEQVNALAEEMTEVLTDRNISIYAMEVLPSSHQPSEAYRLLFSNGKLVKLRVTYKKITNDTFGIAGKSEYEKLRSEFIRIYGKPVQEIQTVGKYGFKAPEEFYTCLSFSRCGEWSSRFSTQDKAVSIELEGMVARGKGEIIVEEEGFPAFRDAINLYTWIGRLYAGLIGGAGGLAVYFLSQKALQVCRRRMLLDQLKKWLSKS